MGKRFWERRIKKTIYTLNVDNYCPEITAITYPLIKAYADKIRAEFYVITERKFPEWPVTYEKLQIYELAQEHENEWNLYVDSDTLIHPNLMDFTALLPKDTIAHHGLDFCGIRWVYDRFFLRDGRHIAPGNWFTIASDWCIELWKPVDDLTPEEAISRINITVEERNSGVIDPAHLIDDYVLSRNTAKYGLKCVELRNFLANRGFVDGIPYLWHHFLIPPEVKVEEMWKKLKEWGLK